MLIDLAHKCKANGYTLLAFAQREPDAGVVLIDKGTGFHRYVTWTYYAPDASFHHGHYFDSEGRARFDFIQRFPTAVND